MLSVNTQTYIEVINLGSFSKAAEKLYMSPVTVMKQINALERRVGVKLVERTTQGVFPTAAGILLYQDARQIVEFYHASLTRVRNAASPGRHVIRIGSSLLNPCNQLLELCEQIPELSRTYDIVITSFEDSRENMLDISRFLGPRIDMFIGPCGSNLWKKKYHVTVLSRTRNMCGVPRMHPLASRDHLTLEDLEGETFVLPARGDSPLCDLQRERILNHHPGICIRDAAHYYSMDEFNECARNGYILDIHEIWKGIHPSIIGVPVQDPDWVPESEIGIITKKDAAPPILAFIKTVRDHIETASM